MRRAFVLPVSAAVVGAVLAIGVSAIDRPHNQVHVIRGLDRADLVDVEVEVAEALERVERIEVETDLHINGEILHEVREKVRRELRSAVEAEDLTDAEREQIQEAMEQLEEQLPMMLGISELIEGLTKEDGAVHKDAAAPEAPTAPDEAGTAAAPTTAPKAPAGG